MTSSASDDVILFDEIATAGGQRFGVATLNVPAALNALSLRMVELLTPQLQQWAADANIAGVILQASGEKAFCAGGDIRGLYDTIREHGSAPNPYAQNFFATEYVLDHLIHNYPKPFLCWGHGIVMGGGVGLLAGASHRVVTPTGRLAMPEINIGLYPDVGGSWFLRRMPGRVGLFLALTAAPLNAADTLFCGLADVCIDHARKADVMQAISATSWAADAQANRATLSKLLDGFAVSSLPTSLVREHFDRVNQLMAGEELAVIDQRLRTLQTDVPWLATAASTYTKGSPTSAAISFALWQRVPRMSLAEVFRVEYNVSLACCAHPDFPEGTRALLVDKDRNPRWQPALLAEVTPAIIEDHFVPRYEGVHPLADLT
jgi:enoyl-CoA hydratase/carnithine racemase